MNFIHLKIDENYYYGLKFSNNMIIKENPIACKNLDSELITLDLAFDSVKMIEMFLNISIQICLRTIFFTQIMQQIIA